MHLLIVLVKLIELLYFQRRRGFVRTKVELAFKARGVFQDISHLVHLSNVFADCLSLGFVN